MSLCRKCLQCFFTDVLVECSTWCFPLQYLPAPWLMRSPTQTHTDMQVTQATNQQAIIDFTNEARWLKNQVQRGQGVEKEAGKKKR